MKKKDLHRLSVVLPVYNEEAAIGSVIENIKDHQTTVLDRIEDLAEIEVILVDDGSKDHTPEIISQGVADAPGFRVITHEFNLGYGAALQTGFGAASNDIIAFFDGDYTFKFENISILLKEFFEENLDMVSGCRFTASSKMPLIRRIGNRFFSFLLYVLTFNKVIDPSSGIRVLKKALLAQNLYPLPSGLNFIIIMTTKTLFENCTFKEIPVPYEERVGPSKLSVCNDGFQFVRSVISVVAMNNPFKMYFLGCLISLILSVLLGYKPFMNYLIIGTSATEDLTWMIAAVFFLNASFISYSLGLITVFMGKLIFNRPIRQSVFGRWLSAPWIYSKFGVFSVTLLSLAVLLYGAQKISIVSDNIVTLLIITTLALNGFLLASLNFLIRHLLDRSKLVCFDANEVYDAAGKSISRKVFDERISG
jgi:glycosyltransferase involved in cell wall biosynthesis